MKFKYIIIIVILLLLTAACKPSIQGETAQFNRNQETIARLIKDFPRFKSYLNDLSEKAQGIFNESDAITDEEAKAKKMREANMTILNDTLYRELNNYMRLVKSVDDKKRELDQIRDQEYRSAIIAVIDNINDHLREAENIMASARPRNYNDAIREINKVTSLLTQAETILKETTEAIAKDKNKVTPGSGADEPRVEERDDLGGRDDPGSTSDDYGGREEPKTKKEDLGGRD